MKLSYSWLCDYLSLEVSSERMSEILTSVGLEVEHMEKKEAVKGNLDGIVIGKVLTCEKHPNADKLKITTVDIGAENPAQIVCGAPNVASGQTVVVATVNATLYPIKGDAFKIKKAKIRDVESFGMICAEDEIGLGESHDGIIVLTEDVKPGTPAAEYYKLPLAEIVYEIGLTPNRMDAMSHMGAVKDIAAFLSNEAKTMVAMNVPEVSLPAKSANLPFEIEIIDAEKCPRYQGVSIANVSIGPSPEWLQNKLKSIDVQPINNVVDITNFVLQECGQPLHAFDYDKIDNHRVIIRCANQEELFKALDEKERKLTQGDLVIAHPNGPMCIAGVFGGIDSGVKSTTKNIFLESAFFESTGIRKTAVHHNLRTEAAVRYEKGADIANLNYALKRAASLICELAGGEIASEIMDLYPSVKEKKNVKVSFSKMNALAGKEYDKEQVKRILSSLCFELQNEEDDIVDVLVPFAKTDIEFEADVVEEIMRIDGLDNIPFTGNISYKVNAKGKFVSDVKRELTAHLVGKGFFEIITNSITNSKFYSEEVSVVKLMNNLSSELDVMRPSMLETALQSVAHNLNRKNEQLKFFEFGKIYAQHNGHYTESERLCMYMVGNQNEAHWSAKSQAMDMAYCKGVVQSLVPTASFSETNEIKLGKKNIGSVRLVDKDKAKSFDISKDVWFIDIDWNALKLHKEQHVSRFSEISKFPGTTRDLALVLDKEVKYLSIEKAVRQVVSDKMTGLDVFDVFESEKLGANKKSYAIRLNFLDKEQTITDQVVEAEMKKIISALEKVGAEVRG